MMRVYIYGDEHTSCFCLGVLLKETHSSFESYSYVDSEIKQGALMYQLYVSSKKFQDYRLIDRRRFDFTITIKKVIL